MAKKKSLTKTITPIAKEIQARTPPAAVELLVNQSADKKWKNWWTRFIWTWVMIFGFMAILYAGPVYTMGLVLALEIMVYKEVLSISKIPQQERQLPWFRALHWYFFCNANYLLYGESIIYYCKEYVFVDAFLMPLATHHRFISFIAYCFGFVVFILNLKKGFYKFQFSMFCWCHMALLMIVFQSNFIINNIFEGLIWFILPVSLVITNDIFAYVAGFLFGKTPLISLSPKKTWEGFIGGFLVTIVFSFFLAGFLGQYPYLTCSLHQLNLVSVSNSIQCETNPIFIPTKYNLLPSITGALRFIMMPIGLLVPGLSSTPIRTITLLPIQLHAVVFGLFASLIAPFGGFFASGLKRAFNIKDFSDSIPGHGGLTDRMDCQFIMGSFASIYFSSFINSGGPASVGSVIEFALKHLSTTELIELYNRLGEYLVNQGIELSAQ